MSEKITPYEERTPEEKAVHNKATLVEGEDGSLSEEQKENIRKRMVAEEALIMGGAFRTERRGVAPTAKQIEELKKEHE